MKRIISLTLASVLLIAAPSISEAQAYGKGKANQGDANKNNNNQGRNNNKNGNQPAATPNVPVVVSQPHNVPVIVQRPRPNSPPVQAVPQMQPRPQAPHQQNAQPQVQPQIKQAYTRPGNLNPQFVRGQRAPEQYRQPQYFVSDWQQRQLRRPPSGYHWVRNDNNQYLLIAITTGIIMQIFANENNNYYQLWSYGEYLPSQYRRSGYYVNNWQYYHLRRPTNGRRWLHVNHQFLLINISNGRIYAVVEQNY